MFSWRTSLKKLNDAIRQRLASPLVHDKSQNLLFGAPTGGPTTTSEDLEVYYAVGTVARQRKTTTGLMTYNDTLPCKNLHLEFCTQTSGNFRLPITMSCPVLFCPVNQGLGASNLLQLFDTAENSATVTITKMKTYQQCIMSNVHKTSVFCTTCSSFFQTGILSPIPRNFSATVRLHSQNSAKLVIRFKNGFESFAYSVDVCAA